MLTAEGVGFRPGEFQVNVVLRSVAGLFGIAQRTSLVATFFYIAIAGILHVDRHFVVAGLVMRP